MKKWKIPAVCLVTVASLLMNYYGRQLAALLNAPLWLDSAGTVLTAYLLGPVCGAMVGFSSNLIFYMRDGSNIAYGLVSVAIGILVGLAGRRKTMETLLGIFTLCAMITIASVVVAVPLNMIFNDGSTGNIWGDAVINFLQGHGVPREVGIIVGQLYLELLDKLLILTLLFLMLKIIRALRGRKAKKAQAPKSGAQAAVKALSIALAAGLSLSSLAAGTGHSIPASGWLSSASAEEASSSINYNDYVQTVYSSQNGLPCGEANDIAQTGDGILWVGTYAGLYRYNGHTFQWMDMESVRNVNCLYVDEEGRLWIGSNDNGLSIAINGEIVNVIAQNQGLPSNSVRSIIKSSDGYYYVGTSSSMQILTLNAGLKILNTLGELNYVDRLAADESGHVAGVTSSGTLYLLSQGRILSSLQMPSGSSVYKCCEFDPEGRLWVGTTENEVYVYDISKGWFEEKDRMECAGLLSLEDLAFRENGDIFVSADNGVGLLTRDGTFERINTNDFNNSIDHMLIDYQGNLWFTSSRLGLLRMAPSDFQDIYSTAGMRPQVVNAIVKWQGAYYSGTDKGLDIFDLTKRHQITNELTELLSDVRIRCMLVDDQNHLWICTYGSGLMEIEPDGTRYVYDQSSSGFGNRSRVVAQLSDGTIAAGGNTGIGFIRDHAVIATIPYAEGKISSMILSIAELKDGRVLAGTDGNGLAVLENWEVTRMLTRDDGLSSEVILRIVPDPASGGVFLVTSNGLCYMDKDDSIRALNNFPYFNNYDIWIREPDTFFVMSSAGIYLVDRSEILSDKAGISYELLDSRRGLNSSLTANSWNYYDETTGELFLPCDTGVYSTNTDNIEGSSSFCRINITSAEIDGSPARLDRYSPIHLRVGTSRLVLYPEIINYSIQEPPVGYWMEGFDSQWTILPQNELGSIVYTNLPSGSYNFHLAVYNNQQDKILSERIYKVEKERELYESPFFTLYLLTVPAFTATWISWLLYKRREREMNARLAEANRKMEMGKMTVAAIARAVDAKDKKTHDHSTRVAIYSEKIARAYGLSEKECQDIKWTALMHDIGKIGVPDHILNKPSRLTDEEYEKMKSHTTIGADILKDFSLLDNVVDGAEYHHERYDGKGYPKGLKGEEIPLFARIIGVADAFDAMTANRVYRKQMDFGYVLGEMKKYRGTQFDPVFDDLLLELIDKGEIDLNKIYHVDEEEEKSEEKAEEKPAEKSERKPEEKPEDNPPAKDHNGKEGEA